MSKHIEYIGVDVGATELWGAATGVRPRRFSHTTKGIHALHRWAVKRAGGATVHLCMEATGVYSLNVVSRLAELPGTEVSMVNPACIKALANVQLRRAKTDMVDAEVIRCYADSQHPAPWRSAPKAIRQLYNMVIQADAVRDSLQQWRNRRHAQNYVPNLPLAVSKAQRAIERTLVRELSKIERAIVEFCANDATLAQQIMILESIVGIARKAAIQILAHGQQMLTECSQKELVAYAGLAPHIQTSGTSVRGRLRIDKRGNRRLRKALYMPALCGIGHNPILKSFYQRLCATGKPKMVALVACMKKLLLIIRSMLIHKNAFNPLHRPLT